MSTAPFEKYQDLYDAVQNYKDKETRNSVVQLYGKIEKWDVSKISIFRDIFREIIFDDKDPDFHSSLDLNDWNMSRAENISYMFFFSNFNGYIGNWDTKNVIIAEYAFSNSKFEGLGDNIGSWNVEKLEETTSMFSDSKFSADIREWKLKNIKFMEKMFYNCINITKFELNKWKEYIKAEDVAMNNALKGTIYEIYEHRPYWYLPGAWEREIYRHY